MRYGIYSTSEEDSYIMCMAQSSTHELFFSIAAHVQRTID